MTTDDSPRGGTGHPPLPATTAGNAITALCDARSSNRLPCIALRLLAKGEPVTRAELTAVAGQPETDLATELAGQDIEYDDQGCIVGWGLTLNPTPHQFIVDGKQLYTWCAPDTLIFPTVIDRVATVESLCPTTEQPIRLTVDPTVGITELDPPTAVVTIIDAAQIDCNRIRATLCDHQHFFTTAEAAHQWHNHRPGIAALPIPQAYQQIARPAAEAMLDRENHLHHN